MKRRSALRVLLAAVAAPFLPRANPHKQVASAADVEPRGDDCMCIPGHECEVTCPRLTCDFDPLDLQRANDHWLHLESNIEGVESNEVRAYLDDCRDKIEAKVEDSMADLMYFGSARIG